VENSFALVKILNFLGGWKTRRGQGTSLMAKKKLFAAELRNQKLCQRSACELPKQLAK
jgi:hypothetical protein